MKRKTILDSLAKDERSLVAAAWDKAEQARRRYQVIFTSFLDPGQRALLDQYAYLWDVNLDSWGGYDEAERCLVAFNPGEEAVPEADYPLVALEAKGNFSFAPATHRDYLGSLMALGMKRDTIGDILVKPDGCQLVLHENMLNYVLANWQAVGRVSVDVRPIGWDELQPPSPQIRRHRATVATLRLDAVVAAAYGISRTQAARLIRAGKLKHNFRPETRCDKLVEPADMLSLAGKGRAQLLEVGGQSRSGRRHIEIARWC
ncbi:MAG: hypothetical protein GX060_04710 [Firmicutes bacterium]|nr:hypothetical protein [Bacillota bacterium]